MTTRITIRAHRSGNIEPTLSYFKRAQLLHVLLFLARENFFVVLDYVTRLSQVFAIYDTNQPINIQHEIDA